MAQLQQAGGAQPAVQPLNGSTALLQSFTNIDRFILPNFNLFNAFKRAIKLFYISYPEIQQNTPAFSQQIFRDYVSCMVKLYRIQPAQMQQNPNFIADVFQEAEREEVAIRLSIKQFIGSDQITNPRVLIQMNGNLLTTINLNVGPFMKFQISADFTNMRKIRTGPDDHFLLSIEGDDFAQPNQQLNDMELKFFRTHPEGYEDWFDFGRGIQLLVCLEYVVTNEKNMLREDVMNFHLQTIYRMVSRRISAYSQRSGWTDLGHKQFCLKNKVTFRRPYATPHTNEMFWSEPISGTGLVPGPTFPSASSRRGHVKFTDMQWIYQFDTDFEDSVCLCSEWCNWNAFFYHNPVYRFLLVRHYQLFMNCALNIPEMYLLSSVHYGCIQIPYKQPVLQLITSANDYRKRCYENNVRQHLYSLADYDRSYPPPRYMNAFSYNKLRNDMNIQKLCHELDVNPFSDICVERLLNYYSVLSDLHLFQALDPRYVSDKRLWFKDLDLISRNKYKDFFEHGYNVIMSSDLGGFDYLFTVDYEYEHSFARTPQMADIMRSRTIVLRKLLADSPLNVWVHLNDFLFTYASVYKFLAKVEKMLPVAHRYTSKREIYKCYKRMDFDFDNFQNVSNKSFKFKINNIEPSLQQYEQNFYVFYALKLYFFAFEIQKHCINSGIKYNDCHQDLEHQVCSKFSFILKNTLIEAAMSHRFPNHVVIEATVDFVQPFDNFYSQYWGRAEHETISPLTRDDLLRSGYKEHKRLYVWWKNSGDNKLKFSNIIDSLNNALTQITDNILKLRNDWMKPVLKSLSESNTYRFEAFDHLMYFLSKAICSMILNTLSMFFKKMHSLQNKQLCKDGVMYTLCKPGWVPLFGTMNRFMAAVDEVEQLHQTFDDEFNRISITCDQTKKMIKTIYRQFYSKLIKEWIEEMDVYWKSQYPKSEAAQDFFIMHAAVGMAFLAAFVDIFRCEFNLFRKVANVYMGTDIQQPHVDTDCFNALQTILNDYFKDKTTVQNALPYESSLWTQNQFFITIKDRMDQLDPSALGIDINGANTIV